MYRIYSMGFFSFESRIGVINEILAKRKKKWGLSAISGLDYDDVCQHIRVHIYQKWHLYDQSRPLEQWVNKIITNQITNLSKTHYLKYAPPCSTCPMNQGGSLCGFTKSGEKCSECPLYKKWSSSKSDGFNIKTAESIFSEHIISKVRDSDSLNLEESHSKLTEALRERLPEHLFYIYEQLFVNEVSEEDLAKELGFKTTEVNKKAGYKQIYNSKREIIKVAKEVAVECL